MRRLQCDVCGEKSEPVTYPYSLNDLVVLANFRSRHDRCVNRRLVVVQPLPQVGAFGSVKAVPVHVRKPHGHFAITGPYGEGQEGETLSCCHCGKHWEVRKGSGIDRGFCQNCMGYVCGPNCYDCIPVEQRLANIEAGRPILTPRTPSILVPESHLFEPETSHAVD